MLTLHWNPQTDSRKRNAQPKPRTTIAVVWLYLLWPCLLLLHATTIGFYTVDRRQGNTGGLGGAFGYFYGTGNPLPTQP